MDRVVHNGFMIEHGDGWMEPQVKARLKMAGNDVLSLNDYEVHLTDKLQFVPVDAVTHKLVQLIATRSAFRSPVTSAGIVAD